MKVKILILTLLVLLTSNVAFGQTRRRSNSKARTTTTVSRPSAAILKAYTTLFENYYFFNYGDDEIFMLFKKPNAQGQGKFIITTESLDVAFAGSYTIKANGKVYVNRAKVKGSLTLHDEPLGFFDNYGVFIQADDNAQVYEEILSKRVMN